MNKLKKQESKISYLNLCGKDVLNTSANRHCAYYQKRDGGRRTRKSMEMEPTRTVEFLPLFPFLGYGVSFIALSYVFFLALSRVFSSLVLSKSSFIPLEGAKQQILENFCL